MKFQDYYADEIGVLSPNQMQVDELYAGEVIFTYRIGFKIISAFVSIKVSFWPKFHGLNISLECL